MRRSCVHLLIHSSLVLKLFRYQLELFTLLIITLSLPVFAMEVPPRGLSESQEEHLSKQMFLAEDRTGELEKDLEQQMLLRQQEQDDQYAKELERVRIRREAEAGGLFSMTSLVAMAVVLFMTIVVIFLLPRPNTSTPTANLKKLNAPSPFERGKVKPK